MSMAKEVSAAVYDFKHNESRDASDFKSFCVAYMVSSRYGVDTRGFDFSRLPREYAEMDTQAFKGELGTMRDVLGEIQSDMYKSMEKNKPAKNNPQPDSATVLTRSAKISMYLIFFIILTPILYLLMTG